MRKNYSQYCQIWLLSALLGLTSSGMAFGDNIPATDPVNEAIFNSVVKNAFPLSPDQIHSFKNIAAKEAEANARPAGEAPPIGSSNIIPVTLKPGELMPIIRVGQGMITSLVIMDANGSVWPITSYVLGDPKSFNVNWDKSSGVLMIQGQTLYAQSNLGVMLKGMAVPVMLNLIVGQKEWDYLDYIKVSQTTLSDQGKVQPVVNPAPGFLNDLLMGIPPQGSKTLVSSSSDIQAWSYNNAYLILTRGTLLSPAFSAKASSAGPDPYNAYIFQPSAVVLVSFQGQVETIKITDAEAQK